MKKFSDDRTKPVKYILTPDNKLQQVTDLADFTIESKVVPTSGTPWEPVCGSSEKLLNAAGDGDYNLVQELLQTENGGLVLATDCLGTSPLHLAARYNRIDICNLLLQRGFSKNLKNKLDKTPLHLAACVGNTKIVEIFINAGANVNCQDMLSMTPLHWAVQYQHLVTAELLLKSGAETELKNKFELTPHDIAVQMDQKEFIKLLETYRSDSYTAVQALVMQLQTEDQNEEVIVDDNGKNPIDPVVIVDDEFNLPENGSQIENQKSIDSEPMVVNLCENSAENSQDTRNKDPEIINLDADIDEELPLITEKNNKVTNFSIVNGVLQSSEEDSENRFSAMQLLQEHGITMIQNDNEENSILNAAMESGHSVVLTEVGKQVLKTVKPKQDKHVVSINRPKKIITVTPQQFLALKQNTNLLKKIIRPHQLNTVRQPGILNKNRATPFSNTIKNQSIQKPTNAKTEVQILTEKLDKAYQTIAEYKVKLRKKQQEVDRYKLQLKLFT